MCYQRCESAADGSGFETQCGRRCSSKCDGTEEGQRGNEGSAIGHLSLLCGRTDGCMDRQTDGQIVI